VFIENKGFSTYLLEFDLPSEAARDSALKIAKASLAYADSLWQQLFDNDGKGTEYLKTIFQE
jgi:hypothetical protein